MGSQGRRGWGLIFRNGDIPGLGSHSDFSLGFGVSFSVVDTWPLHTPSRSPGAGLLNSLDSDLFCKQIGAFALKLVWSSKEIGSGNLERGGVYPSLLGEGLLFLESWVWKFPNAERPRLSQDTRSWPGPVLAVTLPLWAYFLLQNPVIGLKF